MKKTKMAFRGIFTAALMFSLLTYCGNTCYAQADDTEDSQSKQADAETNKGINLSSKIDEIAKNIGLFDGVDSDVTTNDNVNTNVNLPVNVSGNSHNENTDNGLHLNNDKSKNYTKVYNTTNNYQTIVDPSNSSGEKFGSGDTTTQYTSSASRKNASRDTSTKYPEKKSVGRALTEAASTVIETINDADVPLGNDYLSSDWTQVGYEAATCDHDGYTNYYNPETKELETVVEKATGHEYVTETTKGGLFHPDTVKTYCTKCNEIVSVAEEANNNELSFAGILGGIVTVGGALLHKKH